MELAQLARLKDDKGAQGAGGGKGGSRQGAVDDYVCPDCGEDAKGDGEGDEVAELVPGA